MNSFSWSRWVPYKRILLYIFKIHTVTYLNIRYGFTRGGTPGTSTSSTTVLVQAGVVGSMKIIVRGRGCERRLWNRVVTIY